MHRYAIEFRPICSECNREIIGIIDYNEYELETDNMRLEDKKRIIDPAKCPNCGAVFQKITIPKCLPYDNRHEPEVLDWKE